MKNLLKKANKIEVTLDNVEYSINEAKDILLELLDGSYSSPSYIIADHNTIDHEKQKGLWLEIHFSTKENYKEFPLDSLLVSIKPKYNFLTFIRKNDEEYSGKCLNFNLLTNTTNAYKEIMQEIERIKNEK